MIRKVLRVLLLSAGAVLSLLSLLTLFASAYWLFDMFTHFIWQYALGLSVCLITGAFVFRDKRNLLLFTPAFLLCLFYLLPFWLPANTASTRSEQTTLSVTSINVYVNNTNEHKLLEFLASGQPDVLFLSEVSPELLARIQGRFPDAYPFVLDASSRGTFGLAFLSRYPFMQAERVALDDRRRQVLRVQIQVGESAVQLIGLHPLPPLGARWAAHRNAELAKVATLVSSTYNTTPTVVMGDFNAAPWSAPLRSFTQQTKLGFASAGYGIFPTWFLGTRLLSAPIDHVLVSADMPVTAYRVGANVGSDHFPVTATLLLP